MNNLVIGMYTCSECGESFNADFECPYFREVKGKPVCPACYDEPMNNEELSRKAAELMGGGVTRTEDGTFAGIWIGDIDNRRYFDDITTAEAQLAFEDWLINNGGEIEHSNRVSEDNKYWYGFPSTMKSGHGGTRLEAIRAVVEAMEVNDE